MFSPDMPRPLVAIVFALAIVSGCVTPPPEPVAKDHVIEVSEYPIILQWLNLQQEVEKMGPELVQERLAVVETPEGAGQTFYSGLLNQKLQTYEAWAEARDTFQELEDDEALAIEQRQLAGIFRKYNQNRINWYQRQKDLLVQNNELQQKLDNAEQEKALLEQKIQALTDLEAVISTRKEE
jgi:hypothetical protein